MSFCDCDFSQGEVFPILAPFFRDSGLKELMIYYCGSMESAGEKPEWFRSIASALRGFDSLTMFWLCGCPIGDNEMRDLTQALAGHSKLEVLFFQHRTAPPAWRGGYEALVTLLQNPHSSIEELNLGYNGLDDQLAAFLVTGLARSGSLKRLGLKGNDDISSRGWQTIFGVLQNLGCTWEELNETETNSTLATVLASNTTLRILGVSGNDLVTADGWQSFSTILQGRSRLKKLDMRDNRGVNDAVATALANSLQGNKRLKELILSPRGIADDGWGITDDGWSAFSQIVCNPRSINETFRSNHTLQRLTWTEDQVPGDLNDLLRLNRDHNRREAARLKIIKTRFSDGYNSLKFVGEAPFVDMPLAVLPHAFAWMGRGGETGEVDWRFFDFLRSMASLFEV